MGSAPSSAKKEAKKVGNVASQAGQGVVESVQENPLANLVALPGSFALAQGTRAGAKEGIKQVSGGAGEAIPIPTLPAAPTDDGVSAGARTDRARILERRNRSRRRGRQSTLLTDPLGIEEQATTSRRSLLGG